MTAQQLALFDQAGQPAQDPRYQPGAIVYAWKVEGFRIVPFWQVRFAEIRRGVWDWYIHAVPYGENPGLALRLWDVGVIDTGLSFQVPSWDDVRLWAMAAGRVAYAERLAGGCHCEACPDDRYRCYISPFSLPPLQYAAYAEESELVARMAALGDRTHWTWRNSDRKLAALRERLRRLGAVAG